MRHELLTQLLRKLHANITVTADLPARALESIGVAHPHEWELLLGEAWGRGIVGLPETAESGKGRALWNLVRFDQGIMGGSVVDCPVFVLSVSVSAGLGQEG
jgi:hypothetical protein